MKEEDQEIDETVTYDERRDVAIYQGSDGSFTLDDFGKGISIAKDVNTGECYVIPVGTNKAQGRQMKSFIQQYSGEELELRVGAMYKTMMLPGAITDTSFIPEEANEECSVYHWLSIVGEETSQSETSGLSRRKRDISCPFVCYTFLLDDGVTLETECYIFYDLCFEE
jgi:hypothetical protein